MEELKDIHYDAFISYRHSELDSFVAEKIHKKLESFKLPKSARSKVKSGKTKIERVFRDVEELPLSDNLSDPINNALSNSDFLITICSPRYLESKWCMKEVSEFLKTHDREHVLVVLAEDEPCNSFPEILTFEEIKSRDENGNEVISRREIEPLAADTRGSSKKEIVKAIDIAVIKLCAEIFGLNYDDLRQRKRRQKIHRMIVLFGTISAALLLFAIFATITLIQLKKMNDTITDQYEALQEKSITISEQNSELEENNRTITSQNKDLQEKNETIASQNEKLEENNKLIASQYSELQDRYASSMSVVAGKLLGAGRKQDAEYVLTNVLNDPQAYNSDAVRMLYSLSDTYLVDERYSPELLFDDLSFFCVSPDGKYVAYSDQSELIGIYDAETGELIKKLDPGCEYLVFCGSNGVIRLVQNSVIYDSISGSLHRVYEDEFDYGIIQTVLQSDDGEFVFLFTDTKVFALDNNGEILYSVDLEEEFKNLTTVSETDGQPDDPDYSDYFRSDDLEDSDYFGFDDLEDSDYFGFDDLEDSDYFGFDDEKEFNLECSSFKNGLCLFCFKDFDYHYFIVFDEKNGEVYTRTMDTMSGEIKAVLAEDSFYYTCTFYNPYSISSVTNTSLSAYDLTAGEWMFEHKTYEKMAVEGILESGDFLYLYDKNMVVVLEKKNGVACNIYNTINTIVYGWIMDELFYYLYENGSVFKCDNEWMLDKSKSFFSFALSDCKISEAYYINNGLYIGFIKDLCDGYCVKFSLNQNAEAEELYELYRGEKVIWSDEGVTKEIKEHLGALGENLQEAAYSNDGKLIIARYNDFVFKIIDNEKAEVVYVFREDDNEAEYKYAELKYSELTGGYILTLGERSYIFDEEFRIICETNRIVDEADGRFVMLGGSGISMYSIPYVSPEELIIRAKEEMKGYLPSDAIMQKYNIGGNE